ncbi:MAG: myo-inositol-1-phosphate synthase [Christensenella sp.]|uniref:inositol-3-phosphate synthase n=1 Tax=Christensenella sp. TaxID=1935934 RepID=UPI002B20F006|nr:myo-inositol-1-phosphate synthase [Christensenella sp.]MEA5004176.1 myo-inositol-1-phosphate synthase [Christensenella sp.]
MGSKKIRLALVGVGNCAASLVEGLYLYTDKNVADEVGGLMHYNLGGYEPKDVQVVVGFDVDSKKVGKDVSEAIWEWPNCAYEIGKVPFMNAPVLRGPVLDGAPEHLRHYYGKDYFDIDETEPPVDVAQALKDYKVDVILINLPTGSHDAARAYVDAAKKAGCGVVNGIPELLASDKEIAKSCEQAGIPILGDDWKSQIGATIVHRALMKLFEDRGLNIKKSYQLNYAGNTDFINLVMRGETKHVTKHDAISSLLKKDVPIAPGFAFVDNQGDQKTAYILIEAAKFGGAPVRLQLHLEVEDAPNSAGISIDAVRCCKLAMDKGMSGAIEAPSSYFFKHPPVQFPDDTCREMLEEFIEG